MHECRICLVVTGKLPCHSLSCGLALLLFTATRRFSGYSTAPILVSLQPILFLCFRPHNNNISLTAIAYHGFCWHIAREVQAGGLCRQRPI